MNKEKLINLGGLVVILAMTIIIAIILTAEYLLYT